MFYFLQEEDELEDVAEDPVMDIDYEEKKNPQAVVEYIDDIYNFYKKAEVIHKFSNISVDSQL